jgi:HK97 gp10 family phage protein
VIEVTVKIEGLQEVEEALSQAGPKLARAAMRKALKRGGDVFLARAKQRAPILKKATPQRQPGELRDAITEVVKLTPKQEAGRARIGLKHDPAKGNQSPGVYGLFVEFGSVHNTAQPYMRPAYDSARQEAADVFAEEIRRGVESLKK